jgi:hypothetical protein
MNVGVITASVVYCTKCGHRTNVYASRNTEEHKIRYRKCPECQNRMVTKMKLGEERAVEVEWIPLSQAERLKAARARRTVKLDKRTVQEIRYLHSTGSYSYRDLSLAYEVNMSTIGRVLSKTTWADVEVLTSLVG